MVSSNTVAISEVQGGRFISNYVIERDRHYNSGGLNINPYGWVTLNGLVTHKQGDFKYFIQDNIYQSNFRSSHAIRIVVSKSVGTSLIPKTGIGKYWIQVSGLAQEKREYVHLADESITQDRNRASLTISKHPHTRDSQDRLDIEGEKRRYITQIFARNIQLIHVLSSSELEENFNDISEKLLQRRPAQIPYCDLIPLLEVERFQGHTGERGRLTRRNYAKILESKEFMRVELNDVTIISSLNYSLFWVMSTNNFERHRKKERINPADGFTLSNNADVNEEIDTQKLLVRLIDKNRKPGDIVTNIKGILLLKNGEFFVDEEEQGLRE